MMGVLMTLDHSDYALLKLEAENLEADLESVRVELDKLLRRLDALEPGGCVQCEGLGCGACLG
jgi:hypothetical protein